MPRPRKDAAPDLSKPVDLIDGVIKRLVCPPGKQQAFLRDSVSPGLRVRVTEAGAKSFVFEAKLNRQTIRRTIGDVRSWEIDDARKEANRLRVTLDAGHDPRELDRQREAESAAKAAAAVASAVLVHDAWDEYIKQRGPQWGDRHKADHTRLAKAGGVAATRGTRGRGKTIAGPLHPLMDTKLAELTSTAIERWAARQGKTRPTYGRLAWRCLKAFLAWCGEQPEYRGLVDLEAGKTRKTRDAFGKAGTKQDVLLREQLEKWFDAVRKLPNATHSAYLQTLLLIGSRRGELLSLKWSDINKRWSGITIRDKVEGVRQIPLTPYVWHLLNALPRRNAYVFASDRKKDRPFTDPNAPMVEVCTAAGIEGLTLHGLRRSFSSLTEWLEIPAGVVAQIMGHKPSATAEKHYKVRPLDLLRVHHERIEAWMLEQAKVPFKPDTKTGLQLVAAG